jgi:hypothetical protein
MLQTNLPFDVLNLILEYDGRIKYLHKEDIYVNIISKNDNRYNIIASNIAKRMNHIILCSIGNYYFKYYVYPYYRNDANYTGIILRIIHL